VVTIDGSQLGFGRVSLPGAVLSSCESLVDSVRTFVCRDKNDKDDASSMRRGHLPVDPLSNLATTRIAHDPSERYEKQEAAK
jgi:hypothetical protein